jgi:hypothetical protein
VVAEVLLQAAPVKARLQAAVPVRRPAVARPRPQPAARAAEAEAPAAGVVAVELRPRQAVAGALRAARHPARRLHRHNCLTT